jgi:hypothetical protein
VLDILLCREVSKQRGHGSMEVILFPALREGNFQLDRAKYVKMSAVPRELMALL